MKLLTQLLPAVLRLPPVVFQYVQKDTFRACSSWPAHLLQGKVGGPLSPWPSHPALGTWRTWETHIPQLSKSAKRLLFQAWLLDLSFPVWRVVWPLQPHCPLEDVCSSEWMKVCSELSQDPSHKQNPSPLSFLWAHTPLIPKAYSYPSNNRFPSG